MPSIPPAGISPASAFDIVGQAENEPPPAILADKINAATGECDSIVEGNSIADGLAIHLLRLQRGSGAAVLEFGQRFREVRHVSRDAPEAIEASAREALAPGTEAGILRFGALAAEVEPRDPTQINAGIDYLDLLAPPRDAARRFTFTE